MKQYRKLYSFGCSFTEGGGLNSQEIRRFLDNSPGKEYTRIELNNLANYESYPGCLSRLIGCDFLNYGTSRASNELILNTVYRVISALEDSSDILVTIQPSIFSRILLQLPRENRELTVNNTIGVSNNIKTYYELFIHEFFDEDYECRKLLQQIDLFNSWFKSKSIDAVWLPFEMNMPMVHLGRHFVDLDGKSLGTFTSNNRLLLTDIPNFPVNDRHFSPAGNQVIAERIYQHLKRYYD
jgi:hypothetical protein